MKPKTELMESKKSILASDGESLASKEEIFQKLEQTSSTVLIRKNLTEENQQDLEKAQKILSEYLTQLPSEELSPVLTETLESQQILFELNLDGVSYIANTLFPLFEKQEDFAELSSAFSKDYEKIFRSFFHLCATQEQRGIQKLSEEIYQLVLAANLDLRIVFIMLARSASKIRLIQNYPKTKQTEIATECRDIFAPIAHRLGLFHLKNELENLSFQVIDFKNYQAVVEVCSKKQKTISKSYREFGKKMHEILTKQKVHFEISFRNKLPYSIFKKAKKKKVAYEDLFDLVACRIITEDKIECYKILGIINNEYLPLEGRFKDYIVASKPNGYQSLHTTIMTEDGSRFEVQIRTRDMHETAEKGIAAHWIYKGHQNPTVEKEDQLLWIRELAQKLNQINDPKQVFQTFNQELYSSSIYVFTPRGQIIRLPKNATLIDFAYAIHSDVGNHCSGGKINGIIKPIRTLLKNGDQVEIITQKNTNPNVSWLEYTVTNKAHYHIRHYLKEIHWQNSIQLGQQILQRELKKCSIPIEKFEENPEFVKYLEKNKLKSKEDFLAEVGMGTREIASLINFLNYRPKSKSILPEKFLSKLKLKRNSTEIIGTENLPARFAKCCQPYRGDEIVGLVTQNGLISIHSKNCKTVLSEDLDERQIIDLQWSGELPSRKPIQLEFAFPYEIKTFNQITKLIENYEVEILEANLKRDKEMGIYTTLLEFPPKASFHKFQKKIASFGNITLSKL